MNKKKVLLFHFFASITGSTLIAQTGQWKLAGNKLTGTEKLGSTNNFSLDFITNNTKRMSLTNMGNLRFNSDQSSIQFPNPGSNPKPMMFIYESGSTNTKRMVFAYSPAFPNFGLQYAPGDKIDFLGGGVSVMDVDLGNKRVGIGTTTPQSKLHVLTGNSGATPFSQSVITAENSSNAYINLLAPKADETGILFGTSENNVSGGIVYNSPFRGSPANSLQFRTNGNEPRMVLIGNGNVGIGTANPQNILQIEGGSNFNTALSVHSFSDAIDAVSSNGPGIVAGTNNSSAFAGVFHGDILADTYQSSDEKLKQNISDFNNAMSMINALHPKHYESKKEGNYAFMHLPNGNHYGLIAQDVEKVFPNLVKKTSFDTRMAKPGADRTKSPSPSDIIDFKALNYTELIPIIIKAMQELSAQNDDLSAGLLAEKKQNEEQQKQMDELKELIKGNIQHPYSSQTSEATINASLTNASLEQNTPNPFTNTTTFHYMLPGKFAKAQILITDKNGKTIKQINISGTGRGIVNVDASALSSGVYNYSLIVDRKAISTKQMVITK